MNLATSQLRRRTAETRARRRLSGHDDVQEITGGEENRESLREALICLPARQRRAVILRYYLDLPAGEVARLLGVSPQAVRPLTHRGLEGLRTHLSDLITEVGSD